MGVDHTTVLNPKYVLVTYISLSKSNLVNSGVGRSSVRISSNKHYDRGLFVADITHMPGSVCGTWPALWTYSKAGPQNGEIDILENINEATRSMQVLHSNGCNVFGNQQSYQQTNTQTSYACSDSATGSPFGAQYPFQGCASDNADGSSYGTAMNNVGGAVYVMEWTNDVIRMWNFRRNQVPENLSNGNPDPSTWGLPSFTTAGGGCNIPNNFRDHQITLDTTFCGNWAGQPDLWRQTSCYRNNPSMYPR